MKFRGRLLNAGSLKKRTLPWKVMVQMTLLDSWSRLSAEAANQVIYIKLPNKVWSTKIRVIVWSVRVAKKIIESLTTKTLMKEAKEWVSWGVTTRLSWSRSNNAKSRSMSPPVMLPCRRIMELQVPIALRVVKLNNRLKTNRKVKEAKGPTVPWLSEAKLIIQKQECLLLKREQLELKVPWVNKTRLELLTSASLLHHRSRDSQPGKGLIKPKDL